MTKKKTAKKEKDTKTEIQPETQPPNDKQAYWIIGTMIGLIVVFLISYSVFQSFNKFEYNGLAFTKDKFGNIPLFKYYYYAKAPMTGNVVQEPRLVNLYFRVDPRKNNVPVEGNIEFDGENDVYISVNPKDLTQCEYSSVGISTLSNFLISSYIPIKGATPIEELAKESNVVYATCENQPTNYVILIQSADETKITKQSNNCYVIDINGCDDILPAVEKFMVQALVDARARQNVAPKS